MLSKKNIIIFKIPLIVILILVAKLLENIYKEFDRCANSMLSQYQLRTCLFHYKDATPRLQ